MWWRLAAHQAGGDRCGRAVWREGRQVQKEGPRAEETAGTQACKAQKRKTDWGTERVPRTGVGEGGEEGLGCPLPRVPNLHLQPPPWSCRPFPQQLLHDGTFAQLFIHPISGKGRCKNVFIVSVIRWSIGSQRVRLQGPRYDKCVGAEGWQGLGPEEDFRDIGKRESAPPFLPPLCPTDTRGF